MEFKGYTSRDVHQKSRKRYTHPLSRNYDKDWKGNRGKRFFNDDVGLAAAHNKKEDLLQDFNRDTGEMIWNIFAPNGLQGQHCGAFRIGFIM